jgi:hypothetical protein
LKIDYSKKTGPGVEVCPVCGKKGKAIAIGHSSKVTHYYYFHTANADEYWEIPSRFCEFVPRSHAKSKANCTQKDKPIRLKIGGGLL